MILKIYSSWVHKNAKKLPIHDVIPLLTAVPSDSKTTGIAYLKGACWKEASPDGTNNKSAMLTSVISDDGKTWRGAFTLAHELAHR